MWSQKGNTAVISSTLALLLKVMESYRRQELPVTLESVEQDVPYRAFTKSNTIMENVE